MATILIDGRDGSGRGFRAVDETLLCRHDLVVDNDHEHTQVVEYCFLGCVGEAHITNHPDADSYFCRYHVHRSVHVTLKEWPAGLDGTLGHLGS